MSKKKSYDYDNPGGDGGEEHTHADHHDEVNPDPPQPVDPDAPVEYTVLSEGATFDKDALVMRRAEAQAQEEQKRRDAEADSNVVVCHIGDVVSLKPSDAAAKRASGIALGERPAA